MTSSTNGPSTMDKVKNILHLDKSSSTTHSTGTTHSGTAEGVAGPHSSRVANATDPRVDSDLDGSRNAGAHSHNTTHASGLTGTHNGAGHNTTHSSGLTGNHAGVGHNTTGNTGLTGTHNTTTTTAGPHSSTLANKLDPRVDSDHSNQYSTSGTTNTGMGHNTHSTTGTGVGHNHGTTGTGVGHNTHATTGTGVGHNHGTTGTGIGHNTHSTTGAGVGHNHGTTGGISSSTNAGPHNSNLANKADPRVDSDLSGRGNNHGTNHGGLMGSGTHATPGSGTAQNTAGPHNSDLMNKLDPRVDADLDGSKTYGGNKTHA